MKTSMLKILTALCLAALLVPAAAQPAPGESPDGTPPAAGPDQMPPPPEPGDSPPEAGTLRGTDINTATATNASGPIQPGSRPAVAKSADTSALIPTVVQDTTALTSDAPAIGTNIDELRMNFRNAPLDMVLKYLSDAAGFIIIMDTQVRGNVNVISSHPMTRNEAVDLLNSVLNKNGYAAIRDGRTLTIVEKNDAKTRNIPVKTSNDPASIPNNAEIVTQIIPIRYVEARQLVTDLSSFVSPQATIVANEAGNSIVVTDTQSNIRHLAEIIRAIDDSAEGETEIRVFHLKYASPGDVANELASIFPSSSSSSGQAQSPFRFGGGGLGGGMGGGPGGGPGGFFARMMAANTTGTGSQNTRVQKQTQVVAVADARTSSVIVTASKDLMAEIAGMMTQLDVPSTRDQQVFVFHMNNADPQQAAQVLQTMFQTTTSTRGSSSSSSSQNSALMVREQNNASSSSASTAASTSTTGFGSSSSRSGGNSSF